MFFYIADLFYVAEFNELFRYEHISLFFDRTISEFKGVKRIFVVFSEYKS